MCERWDELSLRLVQRLQANGELRPDEEARRLMEVIQAVHQGTILEYVESPKPGFPLRAQLRRRLTLAVEGLAPRGGV
jgi:hypothetical protein